MIAPLSPDHATLLTLAQAPAGGGFSLLLLQFTLIIAIIYFLMVRPQQKQRRQHEEALRNLKKGDEVVTSGGIVGEVLHIKESVKDGTPVKSMDDRVTIRSGESRLIVERGRIAKILAATGGSAAP